MTLEERVEELERQIKEIQYRWYPYCLCKEDWTDGTAYCQQCHKERMRPI